MRCAALAALLLVACGAALPSATSSPSPIASPRVSAVAGKGALPAKGPLVYRALFDATGRDLRLPRWYGDDPAASDIRFRDDAIELVVHRDGGETGAAFNMPARLTYVGELDLSVTPGSRLALYWSLRSSVDARQQHLLVVYTGRRSVELTFWDSVAQTQESLTGLLPLWDLQGGQVVTLTVAVDRERYTLFVNGEQLVQVVDARGGGPTVPSIGIEGGEGSVRIVGARFYELP